MEERPGMVSRGKFEPVRCHIWLEGKMSCAEKLISLKRLDHCFTEFALVDKIEHQRHGWRYGGFHSHGGTPIAGWFVMEKIPMKWMMTRGTPILGNPHRVVQ